jgi:hypothetical protein
LIRLDQTGKAGHRVGGQAGSAAQIGGLQERLRHGPVWHKALGASAWRTGECIERVSERAAHRKKAGTRRHVNPGFVYDAPADMHKTVYT